MMAKKVIAITGMGLCGNAVFCRLVRLFEEENYPNHEISILLFEQNSKYFATGLAYSVDSPHYWTLNNPAAGFKFIIGNESLTEWMTSHEAELKISYPEADLQYVPRSMVGKYLKAQYKKHKERAISLGITIQEISTPVCDVHSLEKESYQLVCGEKTYDADVLFLTTGHLATQTFKHLKGKPGFIRFDQAMGYQAELDVSNEVYIIGGQAAFIDAALWLTREKKYLGVIHSVTRSPPVLTTKGNTDVCDTHAQQALLDDLKKQSKDSLTYAHVNASFWNAYQQDAQTPIDPNALPNTYQTLNYQIDKLNRKPEMALIPGNIDELRAFIKSFYFSGCYTAMWESLNEEGKEEFQKFFYSFLMAYLTGTTPINARFLLHLFEAKQMVEHQGLMSVAFDEGQQEFQLLFESGEILRCKTLIDSSGYSYKPNHTKERSMLLDKLAQNGLISPLTHGGMQLTESYQIIDKHQVTHEALFCLGPVASFNHPVPIPHSSFMVEQDVEVAVKQLASVFNTRNALTQPQGV
jgi:uncharacterized NAD(P)/FAD-binding protein YdhS